MRMILASSRHEYLAETICFISLCLSGTYNPWIMYEQVWLYTESDDGESDVYVHHDIIISAFPLCTAWLDCPLKGGDKGASHAVYMYFGWILSSVCIYISHRHELYFLISLTISSLFGATEFRLSYALLFVTIFFFPS